MVAIRGMKQRPKGQHGDSAGRGETRYFPQKRLRLLDVFEYVEGQQHVIFFLWNPRVQVATNELHVPAHAELPDIGLGSFDAPRQDIHAGDAPDPELGKSDGQLAGAATHVQIAQAGIDREMSFESAEE